MVIIFLVYLWQGNRYITCLIIIAMRKLLIVLLWYRKLVAGNCTKKGQGKPVPSNLKEENADVMLLSKVKYRSIGPYRGGRSAAVAGSFKNKPRSILELRVVAYGKPPTGAVTGKTSVINISEAPLVQLPKA